MIWVVIVLVLMFFSTEMAMYVDNNNINDDSYDHIPNEVGLPDNKMMGLAMLQLYLAPFLVTLPRSILLEN